MQLWQTHRFILPGCPVLGTQTTIRSSSIGKQISVELTVRLDACVKERVREMSYHRLRYLSLHMISNRDDSILSKLHETCNLASHDIYSCFGQQCQPFGLRGTATNITA